MFIDRLEHLWVNPINEKQRQSLDLQESLMTLDILIGIALTVMSLGAVVLLTLWSRHIIERIHARSPSSLREIQNDNKS